MDKQPPKPAGRDDASSNGDTPVTWGATGPANARRTQQATFASPASPEPPPASRQARGFSLGALIGVAAGAAVLAGAVSGVVVATLLDDDGAADSGAPSNVQPLTVEQTSAIAEAATASRQSVVRIESTRQVQGRTEQDIGSGVILDTEGHVVTNAHVVLGTDTLKVILPDGSERQAILVGHDHPFTDIAVLQIGPGGLQPAEPGDSGALKLGETVIAIGNPLAEFDGSISVGVVSGTNRARMLDQVRQADLIQTDAAVNNGNSGGALVNLKGQFVGMPTAVIRQSRSGATVEGIAFALPSNRVLEMARAIIETGGQYPRPSIQAEHVDLTAEVLAKLSQPGAREGALIGVVPEGGAAFEAGIRTGDIITHVGDQALTPELPLLNALMGHEPGESAKVVLNRNGRIIETEVRFAQRS